MTLTKERTGKALLLFLTAFLIAAFFVDGGPAFKVGKAHAAETWTAFNFGGGYGYGNINRAPGWTMKAVDTVGTPVTWEVFQTDCNDVVYHRNSSGVTSVLWASGTVRPIGTNCTLVFQWDGNKVIYTTAAIWASGTNFGGQWKYTYDIYSGNVVALWQYDPSYGWHCRWTV